MVRKVKTERQSHGDTRPAPRVHTPDLYNTAQPEPTSSGSTIRNSDFSTQVDVDISDETVTGGMKALCQHQHVDIDQ